MQPTRTLKRTKIILLLGNKSLAIELLQIVSKFVISYLATFRPTKNLAMSWSEACHGKPLARTQQ